MKLHGGLLWSPRERERDGWREREKKKIGSVHIRSQQCNDQIVNNVRVRIPIHEIAFRFDGFVGLVNYQKSVGIRLLVFTCTIERENDHYETDLWPRLLLPETKTGERNECPDEKKINN